MLKKKATFSLSLADSLGELSVFRASKPLYIFSMVLLFSIFAGRLLLIFFGYLILYIKTSFYGEAVLYSLFSSVIVIMLFYYFFLHIDAQFKKNYLKRFPAAPLVHVSFDEESIEEEIITKSHAEGILIRFRYDEIVYWAASKETLVISQQNQLVGLLPWSLPFFESKKKIIIPIRIKEEGFDLDGLKDLLTQKVGRRCGRFNLAFKTK